MTKRILIPTIFIFFITCVSIVKAADIRVNEDGLNGAYTSITAAITAATDGDRIFIKPRNHGAWFVQDLTINKSLTFLSETPGTKYKLRGKIKIGSKSGITVVIQDLEGDDNTSIEGQTSSSIAKRITIKVIESKLFSIYTPTDYDLSVVRCEVKNRIDFTAGKIIHNTVKTIVLEREQSFRLASTCDSVFIVANSVGLIQDKGEIYLGSETYTYIIANNKIKGYGIYAHEFVNRPIAYHQIINNEINSTIGTRGISIIDNPSRSGLKVLNNKIIGNNVANSNGIYVKDNLNFILASYNLISGFTNRFEGMTDDGTNYDNSLTTDTDKGTPDKVYYDLDLTRNDLGVQGGSYSWQNYLNTGAANVYHLKIPQKIITGDKIKVRAEAYDKN